MQPCLIRNIQIEGFKGIKRCKAEHFRNLNLFIGKNDSCKSTILEALYVALKEYDRAVLNTIIQRRSNLSVSGRELWYNYKVKKPIEIEIGLADAAYSLGVAYDEKSNIIQTTLRVTSKTHDTRGPRTSYRGTDWSFRETSRSSFDFLQGFAIPIRTEFESYIANSKFIDSLQRNDLKLLEQLLGKLKLEQKDKEFGTYLHCIFEKGRKWEFIPHPDFPGEYRMALSERRPIFLNGLGDGVRFGMFIVASSMLTHSAALFIEEIENNQHPDSLYKLLSFLVGIREKNNLQIFLTTHNPVVWRNLQKIIKEPSKIRKSLQVFHVKRDQKTGIVDCRQNDPSKPEEFFSDIDKDLYGW